MPQRKQLANSQGHTPFYPVAGGPGYFPWQGGEQLKGCSAAYTPFRFAQCRSIVPLRVRPFRSPDGMYGAILRLYSTSFWVSLQGRRRFLAPINRGVSAPNFL